MLCPYCHSPELKVLETRECDRGTTRRRRECLKCRKRFTTYEHISLEKIMVVKKDETKIPFDERKIKLSIVKSFDKRNYPEEKVDKISRDIVSRIYNMGVSEITSTKIGNLILRKLKTLDKVAYVRFAYVFKNYEDILKIQE
ncbi:transcriptional regulator NrdR, partial [Candidatus Woesearchaeota archaeon]|nr:transcriptional regulator NrdR [Candidatus Woesearchaeota archaeon]